MPATTLSAAAVQGCLFLQDITRPSRDVEGSLVDRAQSWPPLTRSGLRHEPHSGCPCRHVSHIPTTLLSPEHSWYLNEEGHVARSNLFGRHVSRSSLCRHVAGNEA